MPKPRRTFTAEFKLQAVNLVTEQGNSVAEVNQAFQSALFCHLDHEPACVYHAGRLIKFDSTP